MKKAIIFSISLLLITLAALVGTVLIVSKLEEILAGNSFIGGASDAVLKAYADQQTASLQINQIARLALVDALTKISTFGCGEVEENRIEKNNELYIIWNRDCYRTKLPDDLLREKFVMSFNVNSLISADGLSLSGEDFDYFIEPNSLTLHGIAQKSFQLPIGEIPTGTLAFRPSFKVTIPYDFRIYDALYAFADTVLANCPTTDDKQTCITNVLTKVPQEYSISPDGSENDIYFFTANTVQLYENPYTGEAVPPVRFALNLGVRV